jgi:protocatechuate 3,4-dioxygenase beta subunit
MRETGNHFLKRCFVTALFVLLSVVSTSKNSRAVTCTPTPWDEIGPFYRPNAPERTSIGKGYILSGTVRSAGDCRPLHNVRIEIWQVGPEVMSPYS